jgi:hypothetical protein
MILAKPKTVSRDSNTDTRDPVRRSDGPSSRTGGVTLIDGGPIGHVEKRGYSPQLRRALNRVETLIVDGLQHGFSHYCITCEIMRGGKRELVIRAGKSDKFTIPDDELPH